MKKLLLSLIMLGGTFGIQASEHALRVTLDDGSQTTYLLDTKPRLTFGDADITISTDETSVTYLRSKIESLDFIDSKFVSVENPTSAGDVISYIGGVITACGHYITLYTADGRLAASGHDSISLDGQQPGIYIATIATTSLKIIKR